ncbi:MAG: hypothetical protein LBC02_01345 [Planctomycetaceae bacterium]|nr:hypothetical protein [Planctomycetaceae bacterium]
MAGGNEAQRSDRMELPTDSEDEGELFFGRSKRSLRCTSFTPAKLPAEFILSRLSF